MVNRKLYFNSLVSILALVVLVGLAFSIHRWSVEAGRQSRCQANLTQIGLALESYHAEYGSFPPAYVVGKDERRMHSWRVLLLPFLGHKELYAQYRLDEPWDSPHNHSLVEKMPSEYACESDRGRTVGTTSYLAVVGPETIWPERYVVKRSDMSDGMSTTIHLVESTTSKVIWTEPRDLPITEATLDVSVEPNISSNHRSGTHVLLADGRARFITNGLDPELLWALLTINAGLPLDGVDWPETVSGKFPPARDAGEFNSTDVVPHLATPILAGRSCIYCCTFQIAWDEFTEKFVGSPMQLKGGGPLAAELNRQPFDRSNLSARNYLAVTVRAEEGNLDRIHSDILSKFPSAAARFPFPEQIPEHRGAMYAFLQKNLPFRIHFQDFNKPLTFRASTGAVQVESFGIEDYDPDHRTDDAMAEQVEINDFVSEDDFVVTLRTTAGDEIILAKMEPQASMAETVTAVFDRQAKQQDRLRGKETLIVPMMALNIEKTYSELMGKPFSNPSMKGFRLVMAWQAIRFLLNESGARLESTAVIAYDNGDPPDAARPRRLIFDRPFLICLREKQASQPYLAIWVANDELLVPHR